MAFPQWAVLADWVILSHQLVLRFCQPHCRIAQIFAVEKNFRCIAFSFCDIFSHSSLNREAQRRRSSSYPGNVSTNDFFFSSIFYQHLSCVSRLGRTFSCLRFAGLMPHWDLARLLSLSLLFALPSAEASGFPVSLSLKGASPCCMRLMLFWKFLRNAAADLASKTSPVFSRWCDQTKTNWLDQHHYFYAPIGLILITVWQAVKRFFWQRNLRRNSSVVWTLAAGCLFRYHYLIDYNSTFYRS